MLFANRTLLATALAAGVAAFTAPAFAADVPMFAPPPPPPPSAAVPFSLTDVAGCYNVVQGLPAGYAMSFCLTGDHDGQYRLSGPGFSCERRLDYQDRRDGAPHIELGRLGLCDGANQLLTNDLNCLITAPGIVCTFDRERGVPNSQIVAVRVY